MSHETIQQTHSGGGCHAYRGCGPPACVSATGQILKRENLSVGPPRHAKSNFLHETGLRAKAGTILYLRPVIDLSHASMNMKRQPLPNSL